MSDTLSQFTLVCSGCDEIAPAADMFHLVESEGMQRRYVRGTYCARCAELHRWGLPLPKSRFPRTAAFSLDGKTWTACDLRDAPS